MKVFTFKLRKEQFFTLLFVFVIISTTYTTYVREKNATITANMPVYAKTIIIDAGHGGWDPGRAGTLGEHEKDINLKIAKKLQEYLETSGATVFITRDDDSALAEGKTDDLEERKDLSAEGDLFISIHQNAFPQPEIKGAQVFYKDSHEEGQKLAELLQSRLIEIVDPDNTRVAKPNKDYYILRHSDVPAAIVECGFLSNEQEEKKLNDDGYQDKIAWAIYMGIMDYYKDSQGVDDV